MPVFNADLPTLLRSIKSPTMQSQVNAYFAQGGSVTYDGKDHSHYIPKPLFNNISAPGEIHINAIDITSTAARLGAPATAVAKAMLAHEMGHAVYATADLSNYQGTVEGRISWCIKREAEAAAFSFKVGMEQKGTDVGSFIVLGPPTKPDLFPYLAAAVSGIAIQSNQYIDKLVDAAKSYYGADPSYYSRCEKWAKDGGLPPSYQLPIDPNAPGTGGGGGGGGSGGGGSVKIPGGYWQEVEIPQHPSNLTDETPAHQASAPLLITENLDLGLLFEEPHLSRHGKVTAEAAESYVVAGASVGLSVSWLPNVESAKTPDMRPEQSIHEVVDADIRLVGVASHHVSYPGE